MVSTMKLNYNPKAFASVVNYNHKAFTILVNYDPKYDAKIWIISYDCNL
jgi:hypothetical protein